MKSIYKMLLAVALFCSVTWQVAAQVVVVPPTDGTYFYIQFTRGKNLVLESQGSGTVNEFGFAVAGSNVLKTQVLEFGKATQLWKAEVNGAGYTFISKALDVDGITKLQISWDIATQRFVVTPYSNASSPLYTTTTGITTTAAYLPACAIVIDPAATGGGMNPVGGSAPGNVMGLFNLTDDGNALRFVASSSFLLDAINRVTTASLDKEGRSAEVQAALQAAIDAAKAVYDNPASTDANYAASIDALNAALIVYDAVVGPPLTSDPNNPQYFYIQFTRGTNLVLENKGAGNQLQTASFAFNESQLWRADADPNHPGAYVFVSKAFDAAAGGEVKMSWDATASRFVAVANDGINGLYTTSRGITTNANFLPASVIMVSPNAAMAMNPVGGSDAGKTLGLWNITDDGDALKFVPEASTKTYLTAYLTQANAVLAAASLNPGNHSAEVLATFRAAVVSAQAVSNNTASTLEEVVAAGKLLIDALAAYNAAPYTILPEISSADASNEKWYFFQGTRPTNSYMTSTGVGAEVLSKTVIPDDTQLWKIVSNDNPLGTKDGYALVNKKTGEYLNADLPNNTSLNTTPAMPALNLVFNISTIMTNGVARFWIENSGSTSADATLCTFRLHAGQSKVLNWFGNRTDNSSWLLMDYSISLKGFLKEAITAATAVVNDVKHTGTALGQYPADAQLALAQAVTIAQAVYESESASDADVKMAIKSLNDAVIICNGRRGNAVISTAANPRWFVIRNLFRTDAALVKNQVISTHGLSANGELFCEAKANTNEQLWRFEANAIGVKIVSAVLPDSAIQDAGYNVQQKLSSVANASGYIIDSLGIGLRLTSTVGNQLHQAGDGRLYTWTDGAGSATNWAIEERTLPLFLPQTITFDAIPTKLTTDAPFNLTATTTLVGGSITYTSSNVAVATVEGSLVTIGGAGVTTITASNDGDATYARASVQQMLTVNLPNGLNDVTDGISVLVKNKRIVVTGTYVPVKAFAVTGVEVDANKVLAPGIYVVKVAGKTVKVNVQ